MMEAKMKIRNGFVSNSSSSSFIVAFPYKPKGADDVHKIMFDGKDGCLSVYDYDGLSFHQVAHHVFNSIKENKFKKATAKELVDLLAPRYFYYTKQYGFFQFGRDEYGGGWSIKIDKYSGSDKKNMDKLREVAIEFQKEEDELNLWQEKIMARSGLKHPCPAAYEGWKDENGKEFTKEQEKQYKEDCNAFYKKLEAFRNSDPEYIEYNKKKNTLWKKRHDQMRKLGVKIAKKDVKNFLADNKGKFVFTVSYSDNDGSTGCTLEHGDIFRNAPHITINNH